MRFTILPILLFMASCSLFKIELSSDTKPLPRRDLNLREMTHRVVGNSFSEVSATVDSIKSTSPEKAIYSNVLLWGINTESGLQTTALGQSPLYALTDTWLFMMQLDGLISSDRSKVLFGKHRGYIGSTTQHLLKEIRLIASRGLNKKDYLRAEEFVNAQAQKNPFQDLRMERKNLYNDWLEWSGIPDSLALTTVGTLPEVMSDMTNRMLIYKQGLETSGGWRMDYLSNETGINAQSMRAASDSIARMLNEVIAFAESSPEMASTLLGQLNSQIEPLVHLIDRRILISMGQLADERAIIAEIVAAERAAILDRTDSIAVNVTAEVMTRASELIGSVIGWLTLLLAVIIILPFGMGFIIARLIYGRSRSRSDSSRSTAVNAGEK